MQQLIIHLPYVTLRFKVLDKILINDCPMGSILLECNSFTYIEKCSQLSDISNNNALYIMPSSKIMIYRTRADINGSIKNYKVFPENFELFKIELKNHIMETDNICIDLGCECEWVS
jgi:hypothetical protein